MTASQASIRQQALAARSALDDDYRELASQKIAESIINSSLFQNAKRIGCYVAMATEVSCRSVIVRAWEQKKRIFTPVVKKNRVLEFRELTPCSELTINKMGLQEALSGELAASESLDIVLTPLVAFDKNRNRVGMGGGYYDREFSYLQTSQERAASPLLGVAFDCQQVEKITPNPWDIRLFRVFTESRTL